MKHLCTILPRRFLALALSFLPIAVGHAEKLDGIVLLISDGTSLELLTAARDYARGASGRLALDDFSHTAFVHTYSGSDYVTDSSAAATAMSRGVKAANHTVGIAAHTGKIGPSILDLAKAAGWSTGVITTDSVVGGTPSPFLVEHTNRDDQAAMAAMLLNRFGSRVDLVLGGGTQYFQDLTANPGVIYKPGELAIVKETQARLAKLPIATFDSWDAFHAYAPKDDRPVLGTFYPDQFPFFIDGSGPLRLKDMVEKAVSLLRGKNRPFLLVIEGEMPDMACHMNMAKRAMGEVLEFDATIAWLRDNLGPNTLLLATTDHNNGGFTINGPPMPIELKGDELLGVNPITGSSYLTWASGPGADREAATARVKAIAEPGKPLHTTTETIAPTDVDYRQPALIPAGNSMHSGGDVWLLADGPGSEQVHGFLNNTDIFRLMRDAISPSKSTPEFLPAKASGF